MIISEILGEFPDAKIMFNKFHVMKMMNEAVVSKKAVPSTTTVNLQGVSYARRGVHREEKLRKKTIVVGAAWIR